MEAQQWELRERWGRREEVGQGGRRRLGKVVERGEVGRGGRRRVAGKVEEEGRKEGKQAGLVEGCGREEVRPE